MGRYSDNAPIGNTCPTIDNIIGKIEYARGEAEYISKHPEDDNSQEANTIVSELCDAINDMENIRNDNSTLRQWGNDEYSRAEEMESERDDAIKKCDDLEREIDDLKAKIDELQEELSGIECAK